MLGESAGMPGDPPEFNAIRATESKRVAVVGAGPGGLSAAVEAASLGHEVTLFEESDRIGGQLNLSIRIPGKQEFRETLRYYQNRIESMGVQLHLGTRVGLPQLLEYDEVVIATGVRPRGMGQPGFDHPSVIGYLELLTGRRVAGQSVAIIGAGGIGFDVAEYLTHDGEDDSVEAYLKWWGVDTTGQTSGGLTTPQGAKSARKVYLLQRRPGKPGGRLGKTTGWVVKARLERRGVEMLGGARYERVDDAGLHLTIMGVPRVLEVETVVVCAGQEPRNELVAPLRAAGKRVHVVGGANGSDGLDAKRAILEGVVVGQGVG